ncbi:hypothetical protein [Streptosporangium sp. NPDC004631]
MGEPSCGPNCGGCRKCDIYAGKSAAEQVAALVTRVKTLNEMGHQAKPKK